MTTGKTFKQDFTEVFCLFNSSPSSRGEMLMRKPESTILSHFATPTKCYEGLWNFPVQSQH